MKKTILFVLLCWVLLSVYILIVRKDNQNGFQSQLDREAEALRASLAQLSGEIAQIRLTAFEKETKYNEVLASLTNYQPATMNDADSKKDNDSKPTIEPVIWYWKCESEDETTEWQFDYRNYTLNENCNYFADTALCYENNKEKCIIFPTEQEYREWLAQ